MEKKNKKSDQIDENKKCATPWPSVRKQKAHVTWMIIFNDFYEHI